jgi:hypothetical protein
LAYKYTEYKENSEYILKRQRKNRTPEGVRSEIKEIQRGDYSSSMAPMGQAPAQEPQEMQVSASMLYWVSPWEMAPMGHCSAQVPQEMQASEILYAMVCSSLEVVSAF